MKKVFFSFAVIAVAAVIVSCGNKSAQGAEAQEAEATEQAAEVSAEEAAEVSTEDPNLASFDAFTFTLNPDAWKFNGTPNGNKANLMTTSKPNCQASVEQSTMKMETWEKINNKDGKDSGDDISAAGRTFKTTYKENGTGAILLAVTQIDPNNEKSGLVVAKVQCNTADGGKTLAYDKMNEILSAIKFK